eukprot:8426661-Pyramimonas_sp.AAC.1
MWIWRVGAKLTDRSNYHSEHETGAARPGDRADRAHRCGMGAGPATDPRVLIHICVCSTMAGEVSTKRGD